VWEDILFSEIAQVNQTADLFVQRYIKRPHPQMEERSPQEVFLRQPYRSLPAHFTETIKALPQRLPIYEGRAHFMRRVDAQGCIKILNLSWHVPDAAVGQGVWATLTLTPFQAHLDVFDAAPDTDHRQHFVRHPFPLKETVLPVPNETTHKNTMYARFCYWRERIWLPAAALFGTIS
jgi:hypothetical protein